MEVVGADFEGPIDVSESLRPGEEALKECLEEETVTSDILRKAAEEEEAGLEGAEEEKCAREERAEWRLLMLS